MQLVYSKDGYPYYIPDGSDELSPNNNGMRLPVDDSAFELAASKVRARFPTRIPDEASLAASQGAVGFGDVGKSMFKNYVADPATLPGDVLSGKVDPLSEEGILRAQGLAGLAGSATLAAKPGTASLGSGMVRPMANEVIENAPAFFSTVENAVKNSKTNSATADQWLGYLKNQPGVKPEELQWTGLDNLPTGKITKPELERYIAENKVQLGETWKGVHKFEKPEMAYIEDFKPILKNINTIEDVQLARKHNPNFKETFKNDTDEQILKDVQYYKSLPEFDSPSKYHSYQLPGGENYKELLLTLPHKNEAKINQINKRLEEIASLPAKETDHRTEQGQRYLAEHDELRMERGNLRNNLGEPYVSSHWDNTPNVLAHIRMNDRTINGKKSLHIEEIQSDWHQAGRKQGYKGDRNFIDLNNQLETARTNLSNVMKQIQKENNLPSASEAISQKISHEERANLVEKRQQVYNVDNRYTEALKETKRLEAETAKAAQAVPDAPFKKTWDELALKKVIRHAAENGYDSISWTPGEAQAARYDLSKQISKVEFIHNRDKIGELKAWDKQGKQVITTPIKNETDLVNTIGKEATERLMKEENHNGNGIRKLEGEELKVGGEGMKAFYDKMLVDKANALGKKYGAKVEQQEIKADQGKPTQYADYEDWSKAVSEKRKQPVHVLPITSAMKEAVLKKGQPLFSAGIPVFTPVDHDPWAKKEPKLVPVNFNPFENPNAT